MRPQANRVRNKPAYDLCGKYDTRCVEREQRVHEACYDITVPEYLEEARECASYGDAGACIEAADCTREARERFHRRTADCVRFA